MSYTATVVRSPQPPQASTSVAPSASASLAGAARANKLGLFGMVSEECLDQIRRHVAPIKGLHAWTAQAIYTALAVSASRQGQASVADGQRCWVTIAELAARTGMGRRNIERYLPVLQDAGVIRIIHAHDTLHFRATKPAKLPPVRQANPWLVAPRRPPLHRLRHRCCTPSTASPLDPPNCYNSVDHAGR